MLTLKRRGLLLVKVAMVIPNTSDDVDEVKQSTFLFLSQLKSIGLYEL